MSLRKEQWALPALSVIIAAAAIIAYGRTFSVPFLFDDVPAIVHNPTIHSWITSLAPPPNTTTSGRPLLNLSFAINFAAGGIDPGGYHAVNLAVHILAGLVLFGIVRRTLKKCAAPRSTAPAFFAALLWTLHPLQTESVTYVVQRAESLMGLFYLLTLYAFIRHADTTEPGPSSIWAIACVTFCALGMATKEVMVSAPLVILLFDRTFLSGTFVAAWRKRSALYWSLAATWLLLGALVYSTHGRNGDVGFGSGVSWWAYALTQFPAIGRYLWLSLWPRPLVFDYGTDWVTHVTSIIPSITVVLCLIAATCWALTRDRFAPKSLGFGGAWFFAILAPTSLIPGIRQTAAEHRMYLALVPIVVLLVLTFFRFLGRYATVACLGTSAALLSLTAIRNNDYRSVLSIWNDSVTKHPANPFAQDNLGNALAAEPGQLSEAIVHFKEALRLDPSLAHVHSNLGNAWARTPGHLKDAAIEYAEAIRLNPAIPETRNNLGNILNQEGRIQEAIDSYQQALRLSPDYAEAHLNLAITLLNLPGQTEEAVAHLQTALRIDPTLGTAREILTSLQANPR